MHLFLILSMRATCQARLILTNLTTLMLDRMQHGTPHDAISQSLIISYLRFTSALKRHQIYVLPQIDNHFL